MIHFICLVYFPLRQNSDNLSLHNKIVLKGFIGSRLKLPTLSSGCANIIPFLPNKKTCIQTPTMLRNLRPICFRVKGPSEGCTNQSKFFVGVLEKRSTAAKWSVTVRPETQLVARSKGKCPFQIPQVEKQFFFLPFFRWTIFPLNYEDVTFKME